MSSEPIISVSGLRGIVGESLTPELATRFACAFASGLADGPIVITRDGRATGPMLADAVSAGLRAIGRDVRYGDVAATPTTGVLVRELQAAGGIQISASHNPAPYNGIKLFGATGQVLDAATGEVVVQRYRSGEVSWVAHDAIGQAEFIADTTERHLQLVLDTVDVERIRQRQFRVVLDSNHGAGGLLARMLLERLGCDVQHLGDIPDGQFAHLPEPTAENLSTVCSKIVAAQAAVGFCQDPDADRLAIIDEAGRYIGEEYTLAICLKHVLSQRSGAVVTNCATSRMAEDIARQHDAPFFRSRVGEANVVGLMQEQDAVFGGEGNGGPIDPRVGFVRDSFVGMALTLDAMAARQQPVSALADELPRYEIHKTKVDLDGGAVPTAVTALKQHFTEATPSELDGLRLDWPDRWLLVRASNTEPIVRLIAETPSRDDSLALCDEAADLLARL